MFIEPSAAGGDEHLSDDSLCGYQTSEAGNPGVGHGRGCLYQVARVSRTICSGGCSCPSDRPPFVGRRLTDVRFDAGIRRYQGRRIDRKCGRRLLGSSLTLLDVRFDGTLEWCSSVTFDTSIDGKTGRAGARSRSRDQVVLDQLSLLPVNACHTLRHTALSLMMRSVSMTTRGCDSEIAKLPKKVVDGRGIEPLTSALRTQRSPS